ILCKSVKDAATVLSAVAGYDPKDAATAASVGQTPAKPYEDIVDGASLRGVRIGVVREFMQPHTKADEDSIAIVERAIADLKKAGAVCRRPRPGRRAVKGGIRRVIAFAGSADVVGGLKGGVPRGDHGDGLIVGKGGPGVEPARRTHFTGSGRAGTADVRR